MYSLSLPPQNLPRFRLQFYPAASGMNSTVFPRSRRREPQPAASRASKVAETLPRWTRGICFANRSAA